MSTDNRTIINDCEATTGWTGTDSVTSVTNPGEYYEGSGGLSWQASNTNDYMYTTQDSAGMGTFSLNWSDTTLYMLIKDNLQDTAANGGVQFVVGDGTDIIGYDVGGSDAVGVPQLGAYFNCYKLDMSNRPAAFTTISGSEGNLTDTAITQIGYGCLHLAKANGPSDNVFMDAFTYIANDSYALTINGGTSGTPETMADVAGDDVTNGWGLISNPVGSLYYFSGPTEWGEDAANADHYFTATGEQWFWLGDNGGGQALGATHFPFRVIGNATDTGSFVITQVAVVNTGTGADFDCSSTNVETLEIDLCSFDGLSTFSAPSSGGTSRFCTSTTFTNCGQVTHNGADMSGCSVLTSTVAADEGALLYDENADPDGEMDNMTFSIGTNAHHAIRFGANIPSAMTLRGIEFTGFNSTDSVNDSTLRFDDTTGTITVTLVDCTVDGAAASESNIGVDSAGATIDLVTGAVTVKVTAVEDDGTAIQSARVHLRASDGAGGLPYGDSVTISRTTTTATVTHTAHGLESNDKVLLRGITDKTEDNGVQQVTVTTANAYTFTTTDSGSTSYTGDGFIIDGQDETSYDNSPTTEGTFSGGSGHAVNDVIALRGGTKVTVDAVSSGVVTQFTVDSGDSVGGRSAADVQDQVSTSGSGTGFSLTLDTDNIATQIRSTYVPLDGDTDVNGEISISRVFGSNQAVTGWTRKSTAAPYFKQGAINDTIASSTGLDFTAVMVSDE